MSFVNKPEEPRMEEFLAKIEFIASDVVKIFKREGVDPTTAAIIIISILEGTKRLYPECYASAIKYTGFTL